MGSSHRKKASRQPGRLLAGTPAESGLWSEGQAPSPDELTVPLVRIDVSVAARMSEGDAVQIVDRGPRLRVLFQNDRLGDVAPHYEDAVRSARLARGHVADLDVNTPRVLVRLAS